MFRQQQELLEARRTGRTLQDASTRRQKVSVRRSEERSEEEQGGLGQQGGRGGAGEGRSSSHWLAAGAAGIVAGQQQHPCCAVEQWYGVHRIGVCVCLKTGQYCCAHMCVEQVGRCSSMACGMRVSVALLQCRGVVMCAVQLLPPPPPPPSCCCAGLSHCCCLLLFVAAACCLLLLQETLAERKAARRAERDALARGEMPESLKKWRVSE